jgi:hypothetical protein
MKNCNPSLLLSPLFLVSLLVLGLNDWVLKATFHNFLTGKLSDFAGVFALAIFALAWLPIQKQNYKQGILWAIALFFSWWKSPFSADFIAWWSSYIFPIHRVIDATDLFALFVLPFAASYSTNYTTISFPKTTHYFVSFVACMLFMATSRSRIDFYRMKIPKVYILQMDSLTRSNIDSIFYAEVFEYLDSGQYPINDYEENKMVVELENEYIKPLLTKQRKIANHYQYDSTSKVTINQTDNEGKKQGIWRFLHNSDWYEITYKDDILSGGYKIFNEAGYKLIEGQFINNQVEGMWIFYGDIGKIKEKRLYKNGETIKVFENGKEREVLTHQLLKNEIGLGFGIDTLLFISSCLFLRKEFLTAKTKQDFGVFTKIFLLLFLILIMPLLVLIAYTFVSYSNTEFLSLIIYKPLNYYHISKQSDMLLQIIPLILFLILQITAWFFLLEKRVRFGLLFWWFLAYLLFLISWRQFAYWQML